MWLTPDRATLYALDVLEEREIAGPFVRAACRRHMRDLERDDIWLDHEAADRACRFFEKYLVLSGGQFESRPFLLHPSQAFKIASIFGWRRRRDGYRRFSRAYIEEGKGNGKTPLSAGIGLFGLIADNEPGAQIYSAATTREQADIMFQDAVAMAKANPEIWSVITPSGRVSIKNMALMEDASFFRPVSKNTGKQGSGPRPHFVMADELHEHPNRQVLAMLEAGFKFRRQPLLVMTTNSGSDRKSVCWEERENAIRAANGDLDRDDTFAYICALDDDDDPLNDRSCWRKVNPLLGIILTEDYLAKAANQAKTIPGRRNTILRLHFCVWTDAETAWIPREVWEAIEDDNMRREDFAGQPCTLGMDLASRNDIAVVADVYPDGEIEDPEDPEKTLPCFAVFAHGFTPAETLDMRTEVDRADYRLWCQQGFMTPTPGKFVRFEHIVEHVAQLQETTQLEAVVYDKWMINRFEEIAADAGKDFPLVEHPQGWNRRKDTPLWMPGSIEQLEELILQGRIRVQVSPMIRSAVSGATFLTSPANLRRFDKIRATQRIDAVIAITMAIGHLMRAPEGEEESVYEELARRSAQERRTAFKKHLAQREDTEAKEPAAPSTRPPADVKKVEAIAATAVRFAAFLEGMRLRRLAEQKQKMAEAFGDFDEDDD